MAQPLKFYYDFMSQPARALYMFLKLNNIPFEKCPISIKDGKYHIFTYILIQEVITVGCLMFYTKIIYIYTCSLWGLDVCTLNHSIIRRLAMT